jgi:hypothetical protein
VALDSQLLINADQLYSSSQIKQDCLFVSKTFFFTRRCPSSLG